MTIKSFFISTLSATTALATAAFIAAPGTASAQTSDMIIGEIFPTAANFCPRGSLEANGALLPIASNTAMFSLLGTMYGGDGRTTFGLPDLRGRAAVGAGQSPGLSDYRQGVKGGIEDVNILVGNLPAHSHVVTPHEHGIVPHTHGATFHPSSGGPNTGDPIGSLMSDYSGTPQTPYSTDPADTSGMSADAISVDAGGALTTGESSAINSGLTGNNQSLYNLSPYLPVKYCIVKDGIYPSRN